MGTVMRRLALSLAFAGVGGRRFRGARACAKRWAHPSRQPDEFTVMTAAPLIVPPDFNLRPPQPGAPPRNMADPTAQARAALFTGSAAAAAGQLDSSYSDGEKMLLARTGAANVDPSVRQEIARETHYEIGDPGLTDRVLAGPGATPAPAPAPAPAPDASTEPAAPAPAAAPGN